MYSPRTQTDIFNISNKYTQLMAGCREGVKAI